MITSPANQPFSLHTADGLNLVCFLQLALGRLSVVTDHEDLVGNYGC